MIKVQFKNNYENVFNNKEYTYQNYEGAEVGDIVVVNTSTGFAIARVSQTDVVDCDYNGQLKTVVKIITTKKEIEEAKLTEIERRNKIKIITDKLRKSYLIDVLAKGLDNTETLALMQMSNQDLEEIYKNLQSF